MERAEGASSPESVLSSPPHSPSNDATSHLTLNVGVASTTPAPSTTRLTAQGTVRKKPGPKPKPKTVDPNAPEKKTRKPRKPAEPKDAATEAAPRKRRTKASLEAQHPSPVPVPQTKSEPVSMTPQTEQPAPPAVTQVQRVSSNPEPPMHNNPNLSHINTAPSTPRPASSGQRYDPIRGGLIESKPQSAASVPGPISPPLNRASASPSITSLIDPPSAANSVYPQVARLQHQASVTSAPASPAAHMSRPGSVLPYQDQQYQHQQPPPPQQPRPVPNTTPMEIDADVITLSRSTAGPVSVPMKKSNSAHSNAPTPPVKAARQKEAPPPLPTGSGLLSGTPFGPAPSGAAGSTEAQGVNIWITMPLGPAGSNTVNFSQEVEKRYGFAALHPKIAARKERLRQVTAAGAALEKAAGAASNDDMSLDLSEPDSNVEMGGMEDDGSGGGNGKKRRKRKQEDYDKEDDFIDDTELAWEQQALMAKDGFFVYSGPLITEGEKPAVERFVQALNMVRLSLTFL